MFKSKKFIVAVIIFVLSAVGISFVLYSLNQTFGPTNDTKKEDNVQPQPQPLTPIQKTSIALQSATEANDQIFANWQSSESTMSNTLSGTPVTDEDVSGFIALMEMSTMYMYFGQYLMNVANATELNIELGKTYSSKMYNANENAIYMKVDMFDNYINQCLLANINTDEVFHIYTQVEYDFANGSPLSTTTYWAYNSNSDSIAYALNVDFTNKIVSCLCMYNYNEDVLMPLSNGSLTYNTFCEMCLVDSEDAIMLIVSNIPDNLSEINYEMCYILADDEDSEALINSHILDFATNENFLEGCATNNAISKKSIVQNAFSYSEAHAKGKFYIQNGEYKYKSIYTSPAEMANLYTTLMDVTTDGPYKQIVADRIECLTSMEQSKYYGEKQLLYYGYNELNSVSLGNMMFVSMDAIYLFVSTEDYVYSITYAKSGDSYVVATLSKYKIITYELQLQALDSVIQFIAADDDITNEEKLLVQQNYDNLVLDKDEYYIPMGVNYGDQTKPCIKLTRSSDYLAYIYSSEEYELHTYIIITYNEDTQQFDLQYFMKNGQIL